MCDIYLILFFMQDSTVQTKTCHQCQTSFEITQWDMEFYEKISPTFAGKQFSIPAPTLCPACRQQRRLAFRNERNLYRRICDASGKQIISIYSPDKSYKVYDQKVWWSDQWDPMDYGRDFDFSKTFTEQFGELMREVPHCSILNINSENSEYTNICANNKNCYLIVESSNNEDCYHGYWMQKSKDCLDCAMVNMSEHCFQCVDLDNCFGLYYCQYCWSCQKSYFLEHCINCEFCFGCVWLEYQQYYIFNQKANKEEYEKTVSLYLQGDSEQREEIRKKFKELIAEQQVYQHIRKSENVSWDYIYDSSNIVSSYEINDANNVSYSKHVRFNSWDCMDVDTVWYNSFGMYECINTALDASHNLFCMRCRSWCSWNMYCFNCDSVSQSFGCVGLRNKSYCIFNKQYTKEEYEKMVARIIEHMMGSLSPHLVGTPLGKEGGERGEFFHPSLSPFGYNETVAQEYFPSSIIEKNDNNDVISYHGLPRFARNDNGLELSQLWYKRSEYEAPKPVSDKVIEVKDLPDSIAEVEDSILQFAISCELTGKLFRIQPQELAFYRKHNIPLPRKHPDQRHLERLALRR